MEEAPILAQFGSRRAGELSGGQQRLLEIERALLIDPKLLLVDEPTVGLDPKMADLIYAHLRKLCAEQQRTILMVDQNIIAGLEIADYVYVVELGANRLEGTQQEFMTKYRETIAEWLF
jgi:branched-chain amino acid transport system ATP-binding protein